MANCWKCRSCQQVFETVGKRDAHHRSKHQSLLNSADRNLQRSRNGKFECLCGRTYQQGQGLKQHKKRCQVTNHEAESQDVEQSILQLLFTINGR
jgi:hypothetical protein